MIQKPKSALLDNESRFKIDPVLLVHCFIGIVFFAAYKFLWIPFSNLSTLTTLYLFGLNFLFIFKLHVRLQNWWVYIQWLLIAIIQYIVYKISSQNTELVKSFGRCFPTLKGLFVFLILYQIFRQLSLRYANDELELRGRNADMENMVDFFAFYIILLTTIIAMLYPSL